MKTRIISIFLAFLGISAYAQNGQSVHKADYERQVRNVGPAGVGVETIIGRWAKDAPNDPDMLAARFNFFFSKSQTSEVVVKDRVRFLGQEPVLSLKDSAGRDVNYFQETMFADSLYALAMKSIDKAISLRPDELRYRFGKITALMAYEKESPDMAVAEIMKLIDENGTRSAGWTLDGEAVDDELFCQGIGEYCVSLFQTGSEAGYGYFREVSEKMNRLYPKNTVFINNIGSYWLVARGDGKKARRYYKKVLKLDPDDYAANYNMKVIQSSRSKKGQSSK